MIRTHLATISLCAAAATAAFAQQRPVPSPRAAPDRVLDSSRTMIGGVPGAEVRFTPAAQIPAVQPRAVPGMFLGVLETEIAGAETGLPAGRYEIYLARDAGGWSAIAVAHAKPVRSVRVVRTGKPVDGAQGVVHRGWGVYLRYLTDDDVPFVEGVG
jgi:hypothetical protein